MHRHQIRDCMPNGCLSWSIVQTRKTRQRVNRRESRTNDIDERFYRNTLATFLPSTVMREHLEACPLTAWQLVDLVIGAPVALSAKAAFFEEAPGHMGDEGPRFCEELDTHRDEITAALDELGHVGPDELLYRKSMWDEQPELCEWHEAGIAPFSSLENALVDLRHEMDEEEWDEDTGCWNVIEKWRRGDGGTWENPYLFYFIRDEAVFFERMKYDAREHWWEASSRTYGGGVYGLFVSTPFAAGDIVKLDCRPFSPLKYGLVLEPEDSEHRDSGTYPQVLVRLQGDHLDNRWFELSLKNDAGLEVCLPGYSLLYKVERYDGELPEEYAVFKKLQRMIREDPCWAQRIADAVNAHDCSGRSDEFLEGLGPYAE